MLGPASGGGRHPLEFRKSQLMIATWSAVASVRGISLLLPHVCTCESLGAQKVSSLVLALSSWVGDRLWRAVPRGVGAGPSRPCEPRFRRVRMVRW